MQGGVGGDDAAEVVVEEGQDVVAYFRARCFGHGARPFELAARVVPQV